MVLVMWIYNIFICIALGGLAMAIIKLVLKIVIKIIDLFRPDHDIVVDVEIDDPQVIAKLDNLEQQLEITNAQIQQQAQLLEYTFIRKNSTYDEEVINELDGEILKIKANMLRLSAKSDKLGFQINEIGYKYYTRH